ncbi:hypothetical protein, partial [Brevundimonas sp.]|uniref:hypothetical protein n=1 Tax=Brevundimonas sp. TaxID=1871086 RepID=UPI002FCBD9B1
MDDSAVRRNQLDLTGSLGNAGFQVIAHVLGPQGVILKTGKDTVFGFTALGVDGVALAFGAVGFEIQGVGRQTVCATHLNHRCLCGG